ncbi:CHRD domain-containing protein [Pseudoduganella namucuonensis]|uniref:PEP-CTERM protein-sorting domain-containing protein n=1 Tax=Pseudoduganella namucuonensis TaxID=1035707 RepID=A0A1I7LEZ5_9BURK|nr:CHRD domain-containing protein [Pseudoduganella namucuonensis]SFV08253.1 PEP-CTERM protein-sorting domain-containing protein [Pseudoduganella namucuonensis]
MKTPLKTGLALCALLLGAAAHAAPTTYVANLNGLAEFPPNESPGTGGAVVVFDLEAHTLNLDVLFNGLVGTTTAAHIHCCTALPGLENAGVATETPTFGGFPLGVSGGMYSQSYDTTLTDSWNPAFIAANGGTTAGAEAAFNAGLNSGRAYLNIHSTVWPGGEIRGFLQPVPEPGQWGMLLMGIPAVLAWRRRRS